MLNPKDGKDVLLCHCAKERQLCMELLISPRMPWRLHPPHPYLRQDSPTLGKSLDRGRVIRNKNGLYHTAINLAHAIQTAYLFRSKGIASVYAVNRYILV